MEPPLPRPSLSQVCAADHIDHTLLDHLSFSIGPRYRHIYYIAALWPYTVTTVYTLDSEQPYVVDMTDPSQSQPTGSPATVEYAVLWQQTGLDNTEHTLVMSMESGGQYIVVDALT
jgi:hypothetical protein